MEDLKDLNLTPLEIVTAPLFNHIKNRRERLLVCPHGTPYINPRINFFLTRKTKLKIVLIHVGKCAGETIMTYLRCALPADSFSLFEYHCFHANQLIKEVLPHLQHDSSIFTVIATRDPLERWVASFNWDYHNLILSTDEPVPAFMRLIKRFPQVQNLARGIIAKDPEACAYGKLAHMGKGVSWYLPQTLIEELPKTQTYVVRLENIQSDLLLLLKAIATQMTSNAVAAPKYVPKTKTSYKEAYPANLFGNLDGLSDNEILSMKVFLNDDYAVHERLILLAQQAERSLRSISNDSL